MAPKITLPLFITCQYSGCAAVVTVRNRYRQSRQRFCSHACAARANQPLSVAAARMGGRESGHRRRLAIRAKVTTMPPLEAFRYGYTLGLQSKTRQVARVSGKTVNGSEA